MNTFKYAVSEKQLVLRIDEFLKSEMKTTFTLDELISFMNTKSASQGKSMRILASQRLRNLILKSTANLGQPAIIRTSGLGRGAVGVYEVTVLFDDLLSTINS